MGLPTSRPSLRYPAPMDMPRRRPVVRARLVVLRPGEAGTEVLLVYHDRPGRGFWCFPGGGVEPGETLVAAARREALEEVGLDVRPEGLVDVQDRPGADALDVFLLARVPPGATAHLGEDPERAGGPPVLAATRWFRTAALDSLEVVPRALAGRLAQGGWALLPLPDTLEA